MVFSRFTSCASTRATGPLLAALAMLLCSQPAHAGQEFNVTTTIQACGKWVFKIRDFGKEKIRDYNAYVPPQFQTITGRRKPSVDIQFIPASNTFFMSYRYPDQLGADVLPGVFGGAFGTYTQKGKKLKFRLNNRPGVFSDGIGPLEQTFADLVQNFIFGDRAVNVDLPFVDIRENKVRFKGRVKKRRSLRVKMKARLYYDIRTEIGSEFPDKFGSKGVFKLRMRTKDCRD